jgi:nicotinamidase-related amidase
MNDVLLVVDMQKGLLHGDPKLDLAGVTLRINRLASRVRKRGGHVFFVQHDGRPGEEFGPHTHGWSLLDAVERDSEDRIVRKTLNDAFFGTSLGADLARLAPERLLVTGWATDFCVEATIRSAAALGFQVVAVADGHTVSDRPDLSARQVIEHHHWIWRNLIAPHPVSVLREAEL